MEYFNVSGLVGSTVNNHNKSKKILHIITGLGDGGAEGVLSRLCLYNDSSKHTVISLMGDGKYGPILRDGGVEVICLGLEQSRFSLRAFLNLIKIIKKKQPDVVQTWMYHADLIGGIAARLAGIKNIFWGVRTSDISSGSFSTKLVARVCSITSNIIPSKIICCAESALQSHKKLGYSKEKLLVIQNGYDFQQFNCEKILPYKIASDYRVQFGMVGRYAPQKDHSNLIRALKIVDESFKNWECHLIGRGLDSENMELKSEIKACELEGKIFLDGQSDNMPKTMKLLDIHILSSLIEGFPNVIAEAMACGVVCISTDVGDAKHIIGDTGWVVRPKASKSLAEAILDAVMNFNNTPEEWNRRRELAKERVLNNFSLEKMIRAYNDAWFNKK